MGHPTTICFRDVVTTFFQSLQEAICDSLEALDKQASFGRDSWSRDRAKTEESSIESGGGLTRVLTQGRIFEQAGVNFSSVTGKLPAELCKNMVGISEALPFYATGVSLVIHPHSPMIPTTHANFRYLEVGERSWFGGGMDLTPYYLYPEDAKYFHVAIKSACDRHDLDYYPRFKKWCDEYFYLPHRGEARGVGGIFFDYLGREHRLNGAERDAPAYYDFVRDVGAAFIPAYGPIVERRQDTEWGDKEKAFQLIRRGRYVEFNLIYDRGTLFGLKTGGRTESILMSLPPQVRWEYGYRIESGTREAELLNVVRKPREWV